MKKKLLSVLLTAAFLLSASVPAFAADTETPDHTENAPSASETSSGAERASDSVVAESSSDDAVESAPETAPSSGEGTVEEDHTNSETGGQSVVEGPAAEEISGEKESVDGAAESEESDSGGTEQAAQSIDSVEESEESDSDVTEQAAQSIDSVEEAKESDGDETEQTAQSVDDAAESEESDSDGTEQTAQSVDGAEESEESNGDGTEEAAQSVDGAAESEESDGDETEEAAQSVDSVEESEESDGDVTEQAAQSVDSVEEAQESDDDGTEEAAQSVDGAEASEVVKGVILGAPEDPEAAEILMDAQPEVMEDDPLAILGASNNPVISVDVPISATLMVNPYRLNIEIDGKTTSDSIISETQVIQSRSNVDLAVNACAVGWRTDLSEARIVERPSGMEGKSMFVYYEFANASSASAKIQWSGKYSGASNQIVTKSVEDASDDMPAKTKVLTIPAAKDEDRPSYALFRAFGEASVPETGMWTAADNVEIRLAFTFMPA